MTDIFLPDPENLNQEEEQELTYLLQESLHEFEEGPNGKCIAPTRKFCYEHNKIDYHQECGAASYSVLHYDDDPMSEGNEHWHGGGDCMCFEGRYYD